MDRYQMRIDEMDLIRAEKFLDVALAKFLDVVLAQLGDDEDEIPFQLFAGDAESALDTLRRLIAQERAK